ncbi:MAG: Omp28-related outer membrane protein [Sphingobacteriales bacterium]|jgi:hypothetical protein|nr:Omp28-related outer membrane protein [Sphingobacteriales bacterium]
MKKLFTLAFMLGATAAFAQLPVDTTAQLKNAILEEFTGINCVYCPDGHKIASQIAAANPGRAFAVNIHTGGFATPSAGQPDFRTADGNAIAAIPGMGITGYPQGAVSRTFYPTTATAYAMSRTSWTAAVNNILNQPAYANVAGEATLDIITRELSVNIEVYYTGSSPVATNKLTVMLLQNNINGPQTGATNFNPTMVNPDGTYRHMHALRDVLTTPTTGANIDTTTQGTLVQRTITYTIPATIGTIPVDLSNLEILAFVAETSNKVINVNEVPITFSGFTTVNNAQLVSISSIEDVCVGSIEPKFRLSNQGSSPITAATINYAVNGGTPAVYNWSGNLNPLGTTDITLPSTAFTVSPSNTLDISVVDVNGGTDDDPSNNASNVTFAATTSNSPTVNLTLNLTQDRYGSEITWEFLDGSGNTLANGGPYADLSANGTLLHVENVVVPATGCYRFVIYDSYGDGINSGYGVGSVNIKDGYSNTIYSNNGTFTAQASRNFEVSGNTNTTSIQDNVHLASINLFPNPAAAESRLGFELRSTQEVAVRVINALGQTISNTSLGRLNAGNHQHLLDVSALSTGLYTVELRTGDSTSSLRLTVGQ